MIRQIITNEAIYSENGLLHVRPISTKDGKPRCPKCGRDVKFFNDVDELEGEET